MERQERNQKSLNNPDPIRAAAEEIFHDVIYALPLPIGRLQLFYENSKKDCAEIINTRINAIIRALVERERERIETIAQEWWNHALWEVDGIDSLLEAIRQGGK